MLWQLTTLSLILINVMVTNCVMSLILINVMVANHVMSLILINVMVTNRVMSLILIFLLILTFGNPTKKVLGTRLAETMVVCASLLDLLLCRCQCV